MAEQDPYDKITELTNERNDALAKVRELRARRRTSASAPSTPTRRSPSVRASPTPSTSTRSESWPLKYPG